MPNLGLRREQAPVTCGVRAVSEIKIWRVLPGCCQPTSNTTTCSATTTCSCSFLKESLLSTASSSLLLQLSYLLQRLFRMTSLGNTNALIRSSIEAGIQGQQDGFSLTMKTFNFTIGNDDDDDDLDLLSQATNVSERCPMTRAINPQVCPVMSSLKPPNIIPASSGVQPSAMRLAASQQPTVEFLQSLGIKVRDFAYESTLPPIASIPRVPRQIQPSARPLKRTSREWDEGNGAPSCSSRPPFGRESTNEPNKKPNALVRRPTEPLEFDPPASNSCMTGHADLTRPFPLGSQLLFHTSCRTPPRAPSASPPTPPLFGSPSQEASQDSELVMTPPGAESWNIEDTSSIPASQLDIEPLSFVAEEISYSQAGLSPQPSQPATSFLTPIRSSVSPICVSSPSQAVDALDSPHLIPQIPISLREPQRSVKTPTKVSTERAPRYLLRRRSLLSVHAPTRSRYPHPLTPTKKGSPKASPLLRGRRSQQSALSR